MNITFKDKKIQKISKKILSKFKLCDHCLGRVFAKIETNFTNEKRGKLIRNYINQPKSNEIKNCWLCNGLCSEVVHFADLIEKSLKDYEFDTFLVGTKVDEDIILREQKLYNYAGSDNSESIKSELNREIGKLLEPRLKKEVDFKKPTIMAIVDTSFDVVNLQISPLYIYGKYKKFKRDIPQTKWFCKICQGKGCKRCKYTGKLYNNSVEELISKKFLQETKGIDESFHGCGREDIDVRMLGEGRPFVIEINNPKIRDIALKKISNYINNNNKDIIEISNLRFSNKKEVIKLKASKYNKIYKIVFKGEKPINSEKLKKAVQSLQGAKIGQLTPSRVAHRRADMIREKQIYNCNIDSIDGSMATLTLEAESGTYIKELVSGDNGRTKPNISDMIGIPCVVTELDVIKIKGE